MTSGIPKGKTKLTDEEKKARKNTPEYKAKKKKYNKDYHSSSENKKRRKERGSTPEAKARMKELAQRPESKAKKKEYRDRSENKARQKARQARPENKARAKALKQTPAYKRYQKEYDHRRKEKISTRDIALKHEVCLTYSKLHSNSDVPCCRCCKMSDYLDFLAIDHIQGRKELPENEQELSGSALCRFLKRNKYPEGYQVLCTNCNTAKAYPKNNNKCPHERK